LATIYDVAREANVSTATVSRALRGRAEVQPEVRAHVEEVARRLGYRPNRLAQALSRGKTDILGLVIPNPGGNPFYGDLIEAVSEHSRARGYQTLALLTSLQRDDAITQAACFLEEHQVAGLLLFAATRHLEHYVASRGPQSPPMVAVGSPLDFSGPIVRADDQIGGHEATRYLFSLGHRRVAFLGPRGRMAVGSRQVGYVNAMEEAGLEPWFLETNASVEAAASAVAEIMVQPDAPTGLVGFNDHTALGALRALAELGISVPGQVSVTGFDNLELGACCLPALTTVDLCTSEVARLAVERVLTMTEDEAGKLAPEWTTVPPRLVVRESTGPLSP